MSLEIIPLSIATEGIYSIKNEIEPLLVITQGFIHLIGLTPPENFEIVNFGSALDDKTYIKFTDKNIITTAWIHIPNKINNIKCSGKFMRINKVKIYAELKDTNKIKIDCRMKKGLF